jgi:hypothetical protein
MRRCQSVDSSLDEYEPTNLINMRRRQPAPGSSSNNSDALGLESCFDTEDEVGETDSNTNLTDVDTDIEGENKADVLWMIEEDKDHLLEYYLNQEEEFNEFKDANKDYKDNSILLLNGIEERWNR